MRGEKFDFLFRPSLSLSFLFDFFFSFSFFSFTLSRFSLKQSGAGTNIKFAINAKGIVLRSILHVFHFYLFLYLPPSLHPLPPFPSTPFLFLPSLKYVSSYVGWMNGLIDRQTDRQKERKKKIYIVVS